MQPPIAERYRPVSDAEIWADAAIHGVGIAVGIAGSVFLLSHVSGAGGMAAIAIYLVALMAMLGFSAAYNLLPPSDIKWALRRFDHAAIYLLIAGTYTPLLRFLPDSHEALILGAITWAGAAAGMFMKFAFPGRFDRIAVLIYLVLGWVGVSAVGSFAAALPPVTMMLIVSGGVLYTLGVVFHVWERLKFQNAIWHGFVLAAASCHYVAIAGLYG